MPSVPPRTFFGTVTAPPVGLSSGWTSISTVLERTQQDGLVCQPSYTLVFNLKMTELAQGCSCLRDLSVTNAEGEYSSDAEHLARILSVATMLPADVPARKTPPSAFACGEHTQPRSMVMLETLFGAASSVATGLRIHLIVFDDTLSLSSFLMQLMANNDEMKKKNEAKNRPDPINHDPRVARTRLVSESDYAESLDRVFKGETTAEGPLHEYVRNYPYASSTTFRAALNDRALHMLDHPLHPLSPELLLMFGNLSLVSRTATTTAAKQLTADSYLRTTRNKTPSYMPPHLSSSYLFCGRDSAMNAPFPPELVAAIARAHEVHGEPGLSFSAYHFRGPPATKRARTADAASTSTSASTEAA